MVDFPRARVAVLVGSLRTESISRRVAQALVDRAPGNLSFSWIEIGDLPLYNEDLDDRPPAEWTRMRDEIAACDAVLFVTPEYNRSIPGALKNATDIASRPEGSNVFDAKPAGVVSVSPYLGGATAAHHALRQNLVYLNLRAMQQPEAYIGLAEDAVREDGSVEGEADTEFRAFMAAFAAWIELTSAPDAEVFEEFLVERERISKAYISGDPAPLAEILTDTDPATFFPPSGARIVGAEAAADAQIRGAAAFGPDSEGSFEILSSGSSGHLAWWSGLQHSVVHMAESGEKVPMTLRTTEVFRFEDRRWKLVHRHADVVE